MTDDRNKSNRRDELPPPGSKEAIAMLCTCAVVDNARGEGVQVRGRTLYWHSADCPLHGEQNDHG